MRDLTLGRIAPIVAALLTAWGVTRSAAAQAPAAPQPAPAPVQAAPVQAAPVQAAPAPGYPYPPPPPGYGYGYPYPPPPGYAYPGYPAYQRRPPDTVPYQGGPVPTGYHLEERPRKGLIISGALLTGVPWAIGLAAVSGSNFPNSSGWLVVPALGPWLTLAARHDYHCSNTDYDCVDDGLNSAARTLLVLDGLVQTAGAVMFVVGIASPAKVVARDLSYNVRFTPVMMGRQGYGGVLVGEF